jgi:hypothetical protein
MNDRRVVITGMGVITPVGNDMETFWTSLKNGVSGIRKIETFDTTGYDCRIGGDVLGFDPKDFFNNPKDIRRTDPPDHRERWWQQLTSACHSTAASSVGYCNVGGCCKGRSRRIVSIKSMELGRQPVRHHQILGLSLPNQPARKWARHLGDCLAAYALPRTSAAAESFSQAPYSLKLCTSLQTYGPRNPGKMRLRERYFFWQFDPTLSAKLL